VKLPDFTPLDSGGTTSIIGNIIEYCGGGASGGLNGGIEVTDTLPPVLVSNNYVRMAGYQLNQNGSVQARTYGSPGIWANLVSGELTIDGNVVEQSQSNGIKIYQKVGSISIKNNSLLDNEDSQIYVSGTQASTDLMEILSNKVQLVTKNTNGIHISGVLGNPRIIIRGNSLLGLKQAPNPPSPNTGINLSPNPAQGDRTGGIIQGNLIDNWDQGIYLDAAERSALLPVLLWITNNVLSNNAQGVVYYGGPYNNTNYGFIFHNLLDSSPMDTGSAAQGVKHAISATPNSGTGQLVNRLMFFDSAAPTMPPITGINWAPGSIVFNTTPTAGGGTSPYIGWVYIGSPTNVWKQFGLIAT
jgi:hypothetical protein